MDPKERTGSKWPKMPPEGKLQQLIAYREYCMKGDADHQQIAQDYFIGAVLDEDLTQLYMNKIDATGNL
jgi:hypothetical protein